MRLDRLAIDSASDASITNLGRSILGGRERCRVDPVEEFLVGWDQRGGDPRREEEESEGGKWESYI